MHCKIVVFSEEIARMGVSKYVAPITRFRETRRIMRVAVSKTSAEELIMNMKSLIGDSVPKGLELLFNQSENNGLFPKSSLHEFYKDLTIGYEQPYAIYAGLNALNGSGKNGIHENAGVKNPPEYLAGELKRVGGPKAEFLGTAVFNGDKMTGVLDGHETRFFTMVSGEFQRGDITLDDINMKDSILVFDVRQGRSPKIKLEFRDGKPVINVELNIESDIGSIQSRIQYEGSDKIGGLEEQLSMYIQKGVKDTITKTQKEFHSDIFGFGRKAAGKFITVQEWEDYNWLEHYKEAAVNVEVKVNIRRTGLIYKASELKTD